MLLLSLLLAATPANEPAAISLFRSACMDGSVQLKKGEITETGLRGLPTDGRAALAQSQVEVGPVSTDPPTPSEKQVPNQIYRINGDPETYLVLPVQVSNAKRYAAVCAVVVKGNLSVEAEKLFPDPSKVGALFVRRSGGARVDVPYKSAPVDGQLMIVALRKGWTLLSVAPDTRPARQRR